MELQGRYRDPERIYMAVVVSDFLPPVQVHRLLQNIALNPSIYSMEGSRILAAAADARDLKATGVEVCDLTIGDFAPEQFRAPESFLVDLTEEISAGRNQYPPSDGIPELQKAVLAFYAREMGIQLPAKSVVICGGARPPIYTVFRTLLRPRDKVAYPVPSWNNDYYTSLCNAIPMPLQTSAETNFMPTVDQVREAIADKSVHLFCLNTPLNPCGTVISKEALHGICRAIVDENRKRDEFGWRPVFFLFDQVYWPLTFGERNHCHPLALVPEIAPFVIYIDGISKWLVGTGLRLGWAIVPSYLYDPIRDFLGHMGAWAPRPVQVATAKFMADPTAFATFQPTLKAQLQGRLELVHQHFTAMQAAGAPVEVMQPQGAIYASVRINLIGRKTPDGATLHTNNDIRRYLLNTAHVALVAFQAFGLWEDTGWFRVSVGAVSTDALEKGLQRLRTAVEATHE